MALVLVVHLYATDKDVAALQAFEAKVLPLLADHGGQLEVAFAPSPEFATPQEVPDEVHILRFPSAQAFHAYRADPRHGALAAERTRVIRNTEILGSETQITYG
jgi:uncharacterized protein (DUF1330 family)